ncbi:lysophospholipid acyltransferase family protein [Bdellovibrio sp. 22V]|uniref:lysophospholipid acyltransferase family protein n=1 Tax=Bdellovibrio TaxID=958 RepID=UPI0025430A57|nr:lysophospholipid acyltransferase family protein [Bdellovibrio sp. 22V]WII72195.1 lysophospholipid acyltransferase family protein [Bdellovibrio sp. 22V]
MEEIQTVVRGTFRLILFVLIISTFLLWSFLCHFALRDTQKRLKRFSRNSQFFSGLMLKVFNCDLKVINKPAPDEKFLLVSNHMGFVDILMLASASPMLFVTSNEMRETPFLGLLTEMGGCIYVERRSRTRILDEMKTIVAALRNGFRIVLYPEATSTNGERVLPFKKTLMMAAAHAGVPIQPVVVNFKSINDEDFSLKWRDHVCWYGDIPFVTSMWRSLSLKSVKAEIEFLEQIHPTVEDDRGVIADKAHSLIAAKFRPVKGLPVEAQPPVEMETDPT